MNRRWKFGRCTEAWINILISEQLVDESQIEQILNQIVKDRMKLAKDKFEFGKTILTEAEIGQKTIIALNYYVIYQAARSIIMRS